MLHAAPSEASRVAAARQLGEPQPAHPCELHTLHALMALAPGSPLPPSRWRQCWSREYRCSPRWASSLRKAMSWAARRGRDCSYIERCCSSSSAWKALRERLRVRVGARAG